MEGKKKKDGKITCYQEQKGKIQLTREGLEVYVR